MVYVSYMEGLLLTEISVHVPLFLEHLAMSLAAKRERKSLGLSSTAISNAFPFAGVKRWRQFGSQGRVSLISNLKQPQKFFIYGTTDPCEF